MTMPDETVIYKRFAADTFADAIERLGVERVKNLGKTVNARPLVSENPPSGTSGYRERGDVFINIDSGTRTKKRILDEIASRLEVPLTVEIVRRSAV